MRRRCANSAGKVMSDRFVELSGSVKSPMRAREVARTRPLCVSRRRDVGGLRRSWTRCIVIL
jgi:hypothetical protein